ncbi:MAG: hypothetical protein ABGY24_12625 [bacterium]
MVKSARRLLYVYAAVGSRCSPSDDDDRDDDGDDDSREDEERGEDDDEGDDHDDNEGERWPARRV